VTADEGSAYGAALLAGVGARFWPSVDDACDRLVRSAVAAVPEPNRVSRMNERYAAYRRVYDALRTIEERYAGSIHSAP
jgi:xylulokinase